MIVGLKYIFVLFCSMLFGLNLYGQKSDIIPDTIYNSFYDEMPHFPGGGDSMKSFFRTNLKYVVPEICVQGIVWVRVLVDTSGKLSGFKIIRGIQKDFDNEAIRVLSIMPNWIPAKIDGKPVNSILHVPIKFIWE